MKDTFLMLARTYDGEDVVGWYASEKLDGMRFYWDGGETIGRRARDVSFADCKLGGGDRVSTGFWSRLRKVISVPVSVMLTMPEGVCIDGELWGGRQRFQTVMSVCRAHKPEPIGWSLIKIMAFDLPVCWAPFATRYRKLLALESDVLHVVRQTVIDSMEHLDLLLHCVVRQGGEGLVLKSPVSYWVTSRSHYMLKYKPFKTAEGVVQGYSPGLGKYSGMIGSLELEYCGSRLFLSGLTDAERALTSAGVMVHFRVGETVSFKYRELSDHGLPKEARYCRSKG